MFVWFFAGILFFVALGKTVFGWIFISASKSGLVEKKWSLRGDLPMGRIIATNGEAGIQAELLAPGLHFWKWWWMFSIEQIDPILIPTGKIGVVKAENGQSLESGAILAKTVIDCSNFQDATAFLDGGGVIGVQRAFLRNGIYRINTALFNVEIHDAISIEEGHIGIVTVYDGKPIKKGEIAARVGVHHEKFQDADVFLNNGGERGLQEEILPPGEYYINPAFAGVEIQPQIKVPIGNVGVVTNFIGDEPVDVSGKEFRHGIIVSNGQKGVQQDPLNPGRYPTNLKTSIVEVVPTTNIVLNWANAKTESHELDSHLSTITARTKDGFSLNLDVSQIINIAHDEAPKVIARFGTLRNLISQVLEPTIGNYFRNSVQESNALDFITSRKQKQELAREYINKVLTEYNVVGVDTLIGDIVPPDQLLEPIRKKHIAEQQKLMYEQQKAAEITRKDLENATAEADMQKEVVKSEREVAIAEMHAESVVKKQEGDSKAIQLKAIADAEATKLRAQAEAEAKTKIGNAEASVVQAKGLAEAQAYQKQVEALGADNLTRMNVVKEIADGKVKITPEILITGGNGGNSSVEGLIAVQLMNQLSGAKIA
ncbi:MAG: flotillin family protein [Proteobacteria bacterium]|nr:flotillin family protein [Pseudomonadota bacterium]